MTEKQSQARTLFFQTDLKKIQIADLLSVPRRTLHYWIKENNWESQKRSAENMPGLLAENCYHLIGRFTQQLLGEDRIMKPVTFKEADTLHKLTLTVNKLKKGATNNESMELLGLFMEFVNKQSPAMAQQIMPFVDDYIASRSDKNIAMFRPDHFNSMGLIPKQEQDPEEEKLDLQDIIAWSEGRDIPEEAEQNETRKPEPLPKNEMPANAAGSEATLSPETRASLIAEMDRLIEMASNLHLAPNAQEWQQFKTANPDPGSKDNPAAA